MKGYNAVQYDRQWVRRVMREEKTLIDGFGDQPSGQRMDETMNTYYGNYTYGKAYPANYNTAVNNFNQANSSQSSKQSHAVGRSKSLASNQMQQQSRQSQRSSAKQQEEIKYNKPFNIQQLNSYDYCKFNNDYDDLDNVSKISVLTPKTVVSVKSHAASQRSQSNATGPKSIAQSHMSHNTVKTTTTTRDQLASLQVQLEQEKQLRWKAEQEIQKIKQTQHQKQKR